MGTHPAAFPEEGRIRLGAVDRVIPVAAFRHLAEADIQIPGEEAVAEEVDVGSNPVGCRPVVENMP